MFAIKDVESLKNVAAILVIPFFAAAYVCDGAMETIQDPLVNWAQHHSNNLIKLGGWSAWFLLVVAVVSMALFAIDYCITWVHVRTGDSLFMPWFGITCLTAGLFIFGHVLPGLPKPPINAFWLLGLLAYGLSLLDRAARPLAPQEKS